RHFRQKSQSPVVDRHNRNLTLSQQTRGCQECAITTHDDGEIRCRRGVRLERGRDVLSLKPLDQLARNMSNLRLPRFRHDDHVSNVHIFILFLKRMKNSRLPSRPVIDDSCDPRKSRPALNPASATLSIAACCRFESRTMPPLPTCSRPTSNFGFTSARHSPPVFSTAAIPGRSMV